MNSSSELAENIKGIKYSIKKRRRFMRIGTFLLGSIVGAMAVTYINRNNGNMLANWANAGQSVGNMVTMAKSKLSNMNTNRDMSNNGNKSQHQADQSSQPADMSRVKEILNKDPDLKSKVNEILENNNGNTATSRIQ
jgi:hypothetical protein